MQHELLKHMLHVKRGYNAIHLRSLVTYFINLKTSRATFVVSYWLTSDLLSFSSCSKMSFRLQDCSWQSCHSVSRLAVSHERNKNARQDTLLEAWAITVLVGMTTLLIWVATTFTRVRGRSLAYLSVCVLLACVHLHIQNPRGESESQKLHSIKRMREKASPAEWFHIPISIGKWLSLLTLTVCLCYLENTRGGWSGVELRVQSVFLHREPAGWLMLQIHTNLYYQHYLFFRVSANLVV